MELYILNTLADEHILESMKADDVSLHPITEDALPDLSSPQCICILTKDMKTPPDTIDPNIHSVLFIDDGYIEHPETCFAIGKEYIAEMIPICTLLMEEDFAPIEDADMAPLFREYRRALCTKYQFILELFNKAVEGATEEDFELLIHHVHKTAGSAGTYGYSAISTLCKELEGELKAFYETNKTSLPIHYPKEKKEEYLSKLFAALKPSEAHSEKKKTESAEAPNSTQADQLNDPPKPPAQEASPDIYLIDDDESLQKILAHTAKEHGLSFIGDTSFEAAQKRMQEPGFAPKLALFDVHSDAEPLSGFDLVETFREAQKESLSSTLCILSARGELSDRLQAKQLGIDMYLEKPIDPEYLIGQIAKTQTKQNTATTATILLVDDDIDYCKITEESLQKDGFKTHSIHSGTALFSTIHETNPDIILLDINLVEESGIEILRALRMDTRYRDKKVIMVTASEKLEDVRAAYAAGAKDYLTKPLDLELLPKQLLRSLEKTDYVQSVYSKDPTYGVYTENSLQALFTTLAMNYPSFCSIFIFEGTSSEILSHPNTDTMKTARDKIVAYFSSSEIIGKIDNGFAILIHDFVPEQLKVFLEELYTQMQVDMKDSMPNSSLMSAITLYPNDGTTFDEHKMISQNLFGEKTELSPWSVLTSNATHVHAKKRGSQRILIVSSDIQLQEIFHNTFMIHGFDVVQLHSGNEGYEYILHHSLKDRSDIILFDGDLLEENGLVILQKIKKITGSATPLYLLTSYGKEEDLSEGLTLGATRVFTKPLSMQVLIETIERDMK